MIDAEKVVRAIAVEQLCRYLAHIIAPDVVATKDSLELDDHRVLIAITLEDDGGDGRIVYTAHRETAPTFTIETGDVGVLEAALRGVLIDN